MQSAAGFLLQVQIPATPFLPAAFCCGAAGARLSCLISAGLIGFSTGQQPPAHLTSLTRSTLFSLWEGTLAFSTRQAWGWVPVQPFARSVLVTGQMTSLTVSSVLSEMGLQCNVVTGTGPEVTQSGFGYRTHHDYLCDLRGALHLPVPPFLHLGGRDNDHAELTALLW